MGTSKILSNCQALRPQVEDLNLTHWSLQLLQAVYE